MRSRFPSIGVSCLVCALAVAAIPARAQVGDREFENFDSPLRDDSVLNRARPDYDPDGVALGSFYLFPSLGLGYSYDDNVLRTDSGARGDSFFTIAPRLSLTSDWTRHFLRAFAAASAYEYANLSSESRTAWTAGTEGRLDILDGVALEGAATFLSTAESRTSQDQVGAAEPTPFQRTDANLVFSYNPGKFGVRLGGAFERYSFDPTKLTAAFGGGEQDNRDRNRDTFTAFITGLYEFSPGYGAFIRPSYSKRVYDVTSGRANGRDSDAYKVDGGLSLLLTELITGEAYLGYLRHDFAGANFEDLSGVDFGAAIKWYPSTLLTVHLDASRTPNATTLVGASSRDDRYVELGADYEVLLNLILQAGASYTNSQFDGISRRDEDINAFGGIRYLINSNFTVNANVVRSVRNSTEIGRGFVDHLLSFRITARL